MACLKLATQLADLKRANEMKAAAEVERLRLEYVAREERFVLDGDRQELQQIKADLDDLRRASAATSRPPPAAYDDLRDAGPYGAPRPGQRGVAQQPPPQSLQPPPGHPPGYPSVYPPGYPTGPVSPWGGFAGGSGVPPPPYVAAAATGPAVSVSELEKRLWQERADLLQSGAYAANDPLVQAVDSRLALAQQEHANKASRALARSPSDRPATGLPRTRRTPPPPTPTTSSHEERKGSDAAAGAAGGAADGAGFAGDVAAHDLSRDLASPMSADDRQDDRLA